MVLIRNGTDKNRFRTHIFFLCQLVNARPFFGTDPRRFFPEPVVLLRQPFSDKPHAVYSLHLRGNMADKKKKATPRKAATKAVEPWKDYVVEMLPNTFF